MIQLSNMLAILKQKYDSKLILANFKNSLLSLRNDSLWVEGEYVMYEILYSYSGSSLLFSAFRSFVVLLRNFISQHHNNFSAMLHCGFVYLSIRLAHIVTLNFVYLLPFLIYFISFRSILVIPSL